MPWNILVSSFLLAFAMLSQSFAVPPMEHILKEQLSLTHAQTSLLFTGPIIMIVIVGIPAGLLSDRIGARKAAGIGAIILAIGAILRGTAHSSETLLAFTIVYGIGAGWASPNLAKLVSTWIPREKAGIATGVYSAGMGLGNALGLAITMPLIFPITNNYQGVFFIWSIPPVIAAIAWWLLVKEPVHRRPDECGVKQSNIQFWRVLSNRSLWVAFTIFLLHNFFFFAWAGWVPTLLGTKGATSDWAGFVTSVSILAGIPAIFLMPRWSYKLGLRKPFLWVPSIVLVLANVAVLYVNLSISWLIMAIAGIANATRFTTTLALPVELLPKEDVGTASGLLLTAQIGGIIGSWLGGRILDVTGRLDLAFFLLAGISLATAGTVFMLPETGSKPKTGLDF
jgi:MFS transporter, CP family, cyanate transporter